MFIVLACGGLVLGGVFMPWASVTWWIFTDSASGWDLVSSDALIGVTYIEPYLLITGAAIMMACALPAIVLALTSAESQDTVRTLAKVSSFGAGLAFGVIVWAIVDVIGEPEFSNIAYGVWIILVAAIVGLVASAFMSRWGGGQSRFYVSD
jgi:FtsH-binding integral membrane protein